MSSAMAFSDYLQQVVKGQHLDFEGARQAMLALMSGEVRDAQIGAFLAALKLKGETVDELAGLATGMREKAHKISCKHPLIVDTCGTGGDGARTFNISTTVAFVLAGGGLTVAKHGNRSISSKSGSADVLAALGVNIGLTVVQMEAILDEIGIAFLFAPTVHQAMKHVMQARRDLNMATVFNILGPLTNPVPLHGQVLGVYHPNLVLPMAQTLQKIGIRRAIVVHGDGGLDEASLSGESYALFVNGPEITHLNIAPESLGLGRATTSELVGGTAEENARITLDVLRGKTGARRDVVLLNAALGFLVGGLTDNLAEGIELAQNSIDSGNALAKLEALKAASQRVTTKQGDFLGKILTDKHQEVVELKQAGVKAALPRVKASLIDNLAQADTLGIIAEIKKGSPSKGLLRPDLDPKALAKSYEQLGASAISVLTDAKHFYGSFATLKQVREVTDLPLLCKDFIIDTAQIDLADACGADIILLIIKALSKPQLYQLFDYARQKGLEVLVETHDQQELELALELGAKLIGINNRDLDTFVTNLQVSLQLARLVQEHQVSLISESGIRSRQDVESLAQVGFKGILVGESLVTAKQIEDQFNQLKGVACSGYPSQS